jgi:hypothetical protein
LGKRERTETLPTVPSMAVPETPNDVYIAHIQEHRQIYNPVAKWYEWQPRRTEKLKLCRQNDVAYTKLVKKNPGLHEQHLAEELHRFSVLPVQYKDQKGTVTINPSIPPMGDPIRFHGTQWTGKRFDDMWMFWTHVYPAHAHDIEMELVTSRTEERKVIKWDGIQHYFNFLVNVADLNNTVFSTIN